MAAHTDPPPPATLGLTVPVIHATARFVVIDKPAGLLSVPGKGPEKQDCAISRVRAMFPQARGPMVVHRLDMDTSGLLLIALDEGAQRDLSRQFERRIPEKRYVALVDGEPAADSGVIDLPLRPDIANRPWQIVDFEHGRAATTLWRVLAREIDRTRLELQPVTGRAHQLRVHVATPRGVTYHVGEREVRTGGLGCPIIGDVLYGSVPGEAHARGPRLMLHACALSFVDPETLRRVAIDSPVPF